MVRSSSLQRLAAESAKLNSLTDNLNDLIKETEKKIFEANPGFAFFSRVLEHDIYRRYAKGENVLRFGWCKYAEHNEVKPRWQLVLASQDISEFPEEYGELSKAFSCSCLSVVHVICSVTDCSRELRLAVYENLPEFIDAFAQEVACKVTTIQGLRGELPLP